MIEGAAGMPASHTSLDSMLGGRVRLWQPVRGYRAAVDPVLLAAAIPAEPGDTVLDVGAGAGAAALCVAARIPQVRLTLLEIDADTADLAEANVKAAALSPAPTVLIGDLAAPPEELRGATFDHVMTNPPYMARARGTPASTRNAGARQEGELDLTGWIRRCCRLVRYRGTLTVIHRADRADDLLAALVAAGAGGIALFPLWPRAGVAAKLILVQARPGSRAPMRVLPGLVLHGERSAFTTEAEAILREAAPIIL